MTRCNAHVDGCLICSHELSAYNHSEIAYKIIEREDVRINNTQRFLEAKREKERRKKVFKLK